MQPLFYQAYQANPTYQASFDVLKLGAQPQERFLVAKKLHHETLRLSYLKQVRGAENC